MSYKINTVILASVLCVTTNVNASTILSPTSALASSEFSSDYGIKYTIDQSGLSSGFVSGVTNFDTYLATNPTHTYEAFHKEWFTPADVQTAQVDYNLGAVYTIDRLALWNEEFSGIGAFNIYTSSDNTNFSLLSAGLMPFNNPLVTNYPAEVFSFSPTVAQYVRFTITGCPQPGGGLNDCAIGEVAFSVNQGEVSSVPIPAALPLMASALGVFGLGRRHNRLS